jgi:hypothetical protein
MGRPKQYKTVAEMQKKIDEYFASCFQKKIIDGEEQIILIRPLTMSGLGLALDLSRQAIMEYKNLDKYGDAIKKARMRCENFAEEQLFTNRNAAGVIFNLKNNYNWRDKTEISADVTNAFILPPAADELISDDD